MDGTWNLARLQQYFNQEDVDEISKLKPSTQDEVDFIAWHPEKRGVFTVKSAYQLALKGSKQFQDQVATSSRPYGQRPGWKLIWGCPVPPKVKILSWRISRNAISTHSNLARRSMHVSKQCPICGIEEEDSFHVFLRCPYAQQLWEAMEEVWPLPREEVRKNIGKEWLLHILHNIPCDQRVTTLMILWRILIRLQRIYNF
jgi:hypothetical protein